MICKKGCYYRKKYWYPGDERGFTAEELGAIKGTRMADAWEDVKKAKPSEQSQGTALSSIGKAQQEEEDVILKDKMGTPDADIVALRKEFDDNDFRFDKRWGLNRLKSELKKALKKKEESSDEK